MLASVLIISVGIAGCAGGSTPTSPSSTSIAGSWSGSISDSIFGGGSAQLSMTRQDDGSLAGTWSAAFANGVSVSGLAMANPTSPGSYEALFYANPVPDCGAAGVSDTALIGYVLINVAVTQTRLTTSSTRMSCSGPGFASLNLWRQ